MSAYFTQERLDLQDILNDESNRRGNQAFKKYRSGSKGRGAAAATGPRNEGRDDQQTQSKSKPLTQADKLRAKRLKKFREADEKIAKTRMAETQANQYINVASVASTLIAQVDNSHNSSLPERPQMMPASNLGLEEKK